MKFRYSGRRLTRHATVIATIVACWTAQNALAQAPGAVEFGVDMAVSHAFLEDQNVTGAVVPSALRIGYFRGRAGVEASLAASYVKVESSEDGTALSFGLDLTLQNFSQTRRTIPFVQGGLRVVHASGSFTDASQIGLGVDAGLKFLVADRLALRFQLGVDHYLEGDFQREPEFTELIAAFGITFFSK